RCYTTIVQRSSVECKKCRYKYINIQYMLQWFSCSIVRRRGGRNCFCVWRFCRTEICSVYQRGEHLLVDKVTWNNLFLNTHSFYTHAVRLHAHTHTHTHTHKHTHTNPNPTKQTEVRCRHTHTHTHTNLTKHTDEIQKHTHTLSHHHTPTHTHT